ncbi:cyclopropane-fatty-acyl-phospholipid synthase [Longispora fulva]|uniref:Cyclopropane-fatty-acyl-phospholipid synthase n=1 Tax=Longispora fulva TaxID=619741 RepID=A0A8J7GH02_9ACTN|nr:cyclopropane-fatty-acyl-phospholipid synthase family protein [Longispora fulva]MBG6137786.1 cyclopropane-fatty-acyl-phospholipid synthase [Longispora fulva]GIG62056.1 cyclopropane-fatty-acyl-phospholipid synthase [Longispora fulva]
MIAPQLATLYQAITGAPPTVRIRAWDGSEAGPTAGPALVIRDPRALRRLLWSPNELGLAQAYAAGELDVDGDLADGLRRVWRQVRATGRPRITLAHRLRALRLAGRLGVLGPRPSPPETQARLTGDPGSRERDRAAIGHHYDLSNAFYQLVLDDETMAYSCGYWRSEEPDYTLAHAQRDKLDLICRKLDLHPGMRLLDVGCGWGSLTVHAAYHYGVNVTGVTLSAEQLAHVQGRVERLGLQGRVDVRLQDYRDVHDGPYDAIATVEMGEHVGARNYPAFTAKLFGLLRPAGRLLVQQMSRGRVAPGGGAFIEHYIAPDMHMRPVGETVSLIGDAGFEVRDVEALREHYVRTVAAWLETLDKHWEEAVDLVGGPMARIFRLYLVGGALSFAENRMGVDQVLAVRPMAEGDSGMAYTREGFGV